MTNTVTSIQDVTNNKKRQKFVELAQARTSNAIKSIRLIGNLGNKSAYDFGEMDVKKIIDALTTEIEGVRTKMTTSRKADTSFKL